MTSTEHPPKPEEVQRQLLEMRFPLQVYLGELQAQRDRLLRQNASPDSDEESTATATATQLRMRIRDQQRVIDTFPTMVYRTVVTWDADSDTLRTHALIPNDCEPPPPFSVRGWLIAPTRLSSRLQRCQNGDLVPSGLVVSVNGGPLLMGPARSRALEDAKASRMTAREQRKMERERRKKNSERFHFEREKREEELQQRIIASRKPQEPEPPRAFDHVRMPSTLAQRPAPHEESAPEVETIGFEVAEVEPDEPPVIEAEAPEQPIEPDIANEIASDDAPQTHMAPRPARPGAAILIGAFCLGCATGYVVARDYFSVFGLAAVAIVWGGTLLIPQRSS